eukprot:m.21387 g.21387  ORF g.21387 m.21387 type:complete len:106 (+) comp7133_c0_seq2:117-434(+)
MTGASVVPHIRQRFNWDCGLACAQMVLNWHGIEASQESIEKSLKIKSVWTVDLCKCLAEYGLRTEYFTQVIGVNPEHETDSVCDIFNNPTWLISRPLLCKRLLCH